MPVVLAAVENTEANVNLKECGGGKNKAIIFSCVQQHARKLQDHRCSTVEESWVMVRQETQDNQLKKCYEKEEISSKMV